jgi:ubiquinone/menaquinone biosynthesis C-methylase UbiE
MSLRDSGRRKMRYSNYFSRQARKPTGIFGRFYMSRVFEKGNAGLNALVYENLSVKESDHILEIGFGTGTQIKKIAGQLKKGLIEGVDFSKTMVSIAQKKNKKFISTGKVKIHSGDFNEMRFRDNSFDTVFTVNTIYFWQNPEITIAKIYRILKPGGIVVIGFHDRIEMEKMPLNDDVFSYYSSTDVTELLLDHGGFQNVSIKSKKGVHITEYCAVGTK